MLRFGLVGAGGIGKTHIENIRTMKDACLYALCGLSEDTSLLAKDIDAKYYSDFDEFLTDKDIDVVLICTPTYLHTEQIRAVLLAGKHCISEKPLCLSSQEARELFALAKAQGLQLFVAQVVRFFEGYKIGAELVTSQKYGRLLDAHLYRFTERPRWQSGAWLFDKEKSGLIPFDLHIHDIDFLVSLLGKPDSFTVQKGRPSKYGYNDYYRILYSFGPMTACCEAAWYDAPLAFRQGYRLYFERGLLIFDGSSCKLYEGENIGLELLEQEPTKPDTQTHINVQTPKAYYDEMAHFVSCIRKNKASNIVTSEQVIEVLEIVEKLVD